MNKYLSIIGVFLCLAVSVKAQSNERDSLFVNKCISLLELPNPERKTAIMKEVKAYTAKGDEKSLLNSAGVLYYLGMPVESDSIYIATAAKFPKGEAARSVAYGKMIKIESSAKAAENAYKDWSRRFPGDSSTADLHEEARAHIAVLYVKEHNKEMAAKWLSRCHDTLILARTEMEMGTWALGEQDTVWAEKMMVSGIEKIRAMSVSHEYKSRYFIQYADFLYQLKRYDQALSLIEKEYASMQEKPVSLKQRYADLLVANNKGKEAMVVLAELVKEGKGDRKIQEALKQAYTQANGSLDGYEAYVRPLMEEMRSKIKKEISTDMLKEKAPLFSLQALDNKLVTMESLRGKVVILDFWATWCGPCKRSFPSMKSVIRHYEADTSVVFLFVDCMERVANPEEAIRDFLQKNEYPFTVLMDKEGIVAEKYGVKGIPDKMIIDQHGMIRYRIVGFDEGDDAAVEKLTTMIEAVRKAG